MTDPLHRRNLSQAHKNQALTDRGTLAAPALGTARKQPLETTRLPAALTTVDYSCRRRASAALRGLPAVALLTSIPAIGLSGFSSLSPLAPLTTPTRFTAGLNGTAALFAGSSTIVHLSATGQLVSAVAAFVNRLSLLGPTTLASGQRGDFGNFALAAQTLVDGFNQLQATAGSLGIFAGDFGRASVVERLSTGLEDTIARDFGDAGDSLANLSDLGIALAAESRPLLVSRLQVDFGRLAEVFETDPQASANILAAAADALAETAGSAIDPITRSAFSLSAQFLLDSTTNALLAPGATTNNATLQNFSVLFALSGISDSTGNSRTRLLIAMNQFALVASLTGGSP